MVTEPLQSVTVLTRKAKIVHETLNMEKKYTSPADEFLMHTVEPNNRKIRQKVKNK